jgi:hypothetical protein
MLLQEKEKKAFELLSLWTGESCPVYGPQGYLVLSMERVAAPLFGAVTYGVQLLAYTEKDSELLVWIARRSPDKPTFPGMLDSTVGGSITTGETPFECLIREANEEACFDPDLTRVASNRTLVCRSRLESYCLKPYIANLIIIIDKTHCLLSL